MEYIPSQTLKVLEISASNFCISLFRVDQLSSNLLEANMVNDITSEFHKACINGDLKTVSILLCKQKQINVKRLDNKFESTLCQTIEKNHKEIIELLLEIGVDVNQLDWQRRTPLHYASDLNTAEILLVNGASVHAKTYRGQTPLHKACWRGNMTEDFSLKALVLGTITMSAKAEGRRLLRL